MNFLFSLLLSVLFCGLDAVVGHDLWFWFVTGTFGVKALTYAQAAGLSLLATFAVTRIREPKEPSGAAYTLYVVNLLMMWGLGYAFYHIWCT